MIQKQILILIFVWFLDFQTTSQNTPHYSSVYLFMCKSNNYNLSSLKTIETKSKLTKGSPPSEYINAL